MIFEQAVDAALSKHASSHAKTAPGAWLFELVNGSSLLVEARLEEDWLVFRAAPDLGSPSPTWWQLLRRNAGLPGAAKFSMPPGERRAELTAEIPVGDGVDVRNRVHETCGSLKHALESAYETRPPAVTLERERDTSPALLEEAGFRFAERNDHYLVELDVPGEFRQAVFREGYVAVEVARDVFSEIGRQALGLLLLSASGLVRNARAAVHASEAEESLRFEVRFGAPPSSVEIHHALASLSVACRFFSREVRALQNEDVSKAYLDVMGG